MRLGAIMMMLALMLAACTTPPAPDGSRGWNHAEWCGTSPPSGYCVVPESNK